MNNNLLSALLINGTIRSSFTEKPAKIGKNRREEANAIADALIEGELTIPLSAEDVEKLLEQRAPDGSVKLKIHLE